MKDQNSVETVTNTQSNLNLSDQTKFRLNEINKVKDYFSSEIQEKNIMRKSIAAFDYIDKTLIVLSATSEGISNYFFYKCYWSFGRISKCKFYCCIFYNYRDKKETVKSNKEKNTIKLLCLLKAN